MDNFQHPMHGPTPSDDVRPRPTPSDPVGQGPTLSSVRREEHNLTTREALQLFETAGLPRNQRSIERYCADGKLDAFLDSDEQRYFISRASVERLIGHLLEIKSRHEAVGPAGIGPSRSDGIRPATTPHRQERTESQETADDPHTQALENKLSTLEKEKKQLEQKNFTLLYEKKASEQMVTMMREQIKEDRQDFFTQMDKLVKEIGETKQLVGELQIQVKQIAGPAAGSRPGATTGVRQITEAEIIEHARADAPRNEPPMSSPRPFDSVLRANHEQQSEEPAI